MDVNCGKPTAVFPSVTIWTCGANLDKSHQEGRSKCTSIYFHMRGSLRARRLLGATRCFTDVILGGWKVIQPCNNTELEAAQLSRAHHIIDVRPQFVDFVDFIQGHL